MLILTQDSSGCSAGKKAAFPGEQAFLDSMVFSFSIKRVWGFYSWRFLTVSNANTKMILGNFILVRLKRLQVQNSCPEEIVRAFPDVLMYV